LTSEEQFMLIYAGLYGLLDEVSIQKISLLEKFLLSEFEKFEFYNDSGTVESIQNELKESLIDAIKAYV